MERDLQQYIMSLVGMLNKCGVQVPESFLMDINLSVQGGIRHGVHARVPGGRQRILHRVFFCRVITG